MTNFCTKCGNKLDEGEVCTCTSKSSSGVLESNINEVAIIPTVGVLDDFGAILKGAFRAPISTIKSYNTDSNLIISIIIMAVCSLAAGLFVYCLINSFTAIFSSISIFTSLMDFKVEFLSLLFRTFCFVAAYFITLAGMITLMAKVVFKIDASFKKVVTAIGLSSVIMTCALILGSIFSYIKITMGLLFLIIGIVFSIIYLGGAVRESLNVSRDKVAYTLVPSIAVALFVMMYVLPKIFS